MELKQYLLIVRRWAWLLILGLILGGTGGYMGSRMQEPVYQASTSTLIMRAPQESSSDMTYLSDQQLAQTYVQLLNMRPVREAASARLGYAVGKEQVTVRQTSGTQIVQVIIEDHDPGRAAEIANVLVTVLIEQNETLQSGRYTSTEASIQAQIAQVESQIDSLQNQVDQVSTKNFDDQLSEVKAQIQPLQDEVATLQKEIVALEPDRFTKQTEVLDRRTQIAEKQARIDQIEPLLKVYQEIYSNLVVLGKPVESGSESSRLTRLQSTLELYQNLYINLLGSLETIRLARLQNTANIVQIEPALAPHTPIRPRPLMNTAIAAAVGLILAAILVFLVEYMDDTLKSPDDVERTLGVPVLGFVAEMQFKGKSAEDVYVSRQPRSPVSEAFRSLRTNLEFASVQKPIHSIVVTSPGPAEGKTTVAVNLAAIFALSGKRVALVDGDMRRPSVHRLLGMPNRDGLSTLFRNGDGVVSVSRSKLEFPHLMVITSGSLPPNPAELLGSDRMSQLLAELQALVDVVIIDTPPSLVADAQILAGKVDAVLLVIQPGATHAETAKASLELFKRAGARVIGTVLNRIPRNRDYYYGGYKYYSPYNNNKGYYTPETGEPARSPLPEIKATEPEPSTSYSFLNKIAKLSKPSEELPPPNPPRK